MKLCHNKNSPLNVGKIKAVDHRNNWNIQTGRGLPMDSEDISKDSDVSDSESEKINEVDSSSENSAEESEHETEDITVQDDESEDKYWVFQKFLKDIDEGEELDLKQQQKMFRDIYADFLVWHSYLKRNPIHKQVMETFKDLKSSSYDDEEALRAAVMTRKFLLNRIVEHYSGCDRNDEHTDPTEQASDEDDITETNSGGQSEEDQD